MYYFLVHILMLYEWLKLLISYKKKRKLLNFTVKIFTQCYQNAEVVYLFDANERKVPSLRIKPTAMMCMSTREKIIINYYIMLHF